MDWLTFISTLWWPSVAVVVFLKLAKPIGNVLDRVDLTSLQLKAGALEATTQWSNRVGELAETAEELKAGKSEQETLALPAAEEWRDKLAAVAQIDARGAVLSAFAKVERNLRETHEAIFPNDIDARVPGREAKMAWQTFEGEDLSLFLDSAQLRNILAHSDFEIGYAQALDFIEVMARLIGVLEGKKHTMSNGTYEHRAPSAVRPQNLETES